MLCYLLKQVLPCIVSLTLSEYPLSANSHNMAIEKLNIKLRIKGSVFLLIVMLLKLFICSEFLIFIFTYQLNCPLT